MIEWTDWVREDNKCHPLQYHATGLLRRWKVTGPRHVGVRLWKLRS